MVAEGSLAAHPRTYWRGLGIYARGLAPESSHPAYVAVAPDSFYSGTDEYAPFGNDNGHDILGSLEAWYFNGGRDEDVPRFLAETLARHGYEVPPGLWSADSDDARAWAEAVPEDHDYIVNSVAQTAIGVAIGVFKIRGHVTAAVRRAGWQAVTLQRTMLERSARKYPDWDGGQDAAAGVTDVVRVLSRAPSAS